MTTYDRQTAKFLAVVAQNMPEISGDVMQSWIGNPTAVKKVLAGFAPPEQESKPASSATNIISADHSLTLEEMIAAGRYDWVNSDITAKRFPISGVGVMQFETKLFHFGHDISSDEAERRIAADDPTNPWTPAKIEHTLAYGVKNPDEQKKYPIIGLGLVAEIRGCRRVVYLVGVGWWRCLRLSYRDDGGHGLCRFLAVRKVQNSGS